MHVCTCVYACFYAGVSLARHNNGITNGDPRTSSSITSASMVSKHPQHGAAGLGTYTASCSMSWYLQPNRTSIVTQLSAMMSPGVHVCLLYAFDDKDCSCSTLCRRSRQCRTHPCGSLQSACRNSKQSPLECSHPRFICLALPGGEYTTCRFLYRR